MQPRSMGKSISESAFGDHHLTDQSRISSYTKHNPAEALDTDKKILKMIRRINVLWDELKIPPADRKFYSASLLRITSPPPKEQCNELAKYIAMLNRHRSATIRVLKSIEKREKSLNKCLKALESIRQKSLSELVGDESIEWKRNLLSDLHSLQLATVIVVRDIQYWRRNLWRPHPFIWKGKNYIMKMHNDLDCFENDFNRRLLESIPIDSKEMLCLRFYSIIPSNEDAAAEDMNKNKEDNLKELSILNRNTSNLNMMERSSSYHNICEACKQDTESLRYFFFCETAIPPNLLLSAAKVAEDELMIQCALRVEQETLQSRGVFIPTLRLDAPPPEEDRSTDDALLRALLLESEAGGTGTSVETTRNGLKNPSVSSVSSEKESHKNKIENQNKTDNSNNNIMDDNLDREYAKLQEENRESSNEDAAQTTALKESDLSGDLATASVSGIANFLPFEPLDLIADEDDDAGIEGQLTGELGSELDFEAF